MAENAAPARRVSSEGAARIEGLDPMQVFRNAPARAFLAETAGKLATPGFMGPFAATLGYLVGQDEALGPSLVVGTLAGVLLQLIHSLWTSSPGGRDPDPADGPP